MKRPAVAIVGGGLAGLACATALSDHSLDVSLYESRRHWGGRAGTFQDPATSQSVDHCQHVAMGCCTQFLDLVDRHQLQEAVTRFEEIEFRFPDSKPISLRGSRWLPAPLHLCHFLLSQTHLRLRERISIGKTLLRLAKTDADLDMLRWLQNLRQSTEAIDVFWRPILVSALGDSLDRVSVAASRHVFVRGFMARRDAYPLVVPNVPLDVLYDQMAANLAKRGVDLRPSTKITGIAQTPDGSSWTFASGAAHPETAQPETAHPETDAIVCAVPSFQLDQVFAPKLYACEPALKRAAAIEYAPITSIHLWTNQPFMDRPHVVLPGGFVDWIFARNETTSQGEHYYQLVISGSHDLQGRSDESIIAAAVEQLRQHWPALTLHGIDRYQVITQRRAAMSMRVGIEELRPAQRSPLPRLYLAGDYTRTGWPSTMEGAVCSGYLAAESLLADLLDVEPSVLKKEPTVGWLARRLGCALPPR